MKYIITTMMKVAQVTIVTIIIVPTNNRKYANTNCSNSNDNNENDNTNNKKKSLCVAVHACHHAAACFTALAGGKTHE